MSAITAIIADHVPIYLRGLATCLQAAPEVTLTGVARTEVRAYDLVVDRQPSVAVVGFSPEEGRSFSRRCRAASLNVAVLLVADPDGDSILQGLTSGAAGVLDRSTGETEIVRAVVDAAAGRAILSTAQGGRLAAALTRSGKSPPTLTGREMAVLVGLAKGMTAVEISSDLGISLSTTKTHVQNVYLKLGVHERGAAVATAIRRGLIQ